MVEFSKSLAEKGLPTRVNSYGDIITLISAFRQELIGLNFWQYYVLDTSKERAAVKAALPTAPAWEGPIIARKTVAELADFIRAHGELDESKKFHSRYAVTVNPEYAASLVRAAFTELEDEDALADGWVRIVDVLNVPLYQEWEEDTRVALDNIKNRIDYTRLADHGPKLREITEA